MPSLCSNLISPHPNLVYLVLPSSVSLFNFPIMDLNSPFLLNSLLEKNGPQIINYKRLCICIYIYISFKSSFSYRRIPSLGSGKALTAELLARSLMTYHILLLSVEFHQALGSPVQMAWSDNVVPPDQAFNKTEIFIINALEMPSPTLEGD